MLRTIRITLATVMFIGITWLFVDFTGTALHWFSWMPKLQAMEAILDCSVICPLGIMQDIFGWLGKKQKKNRYTYSKELQWLRYPVLVVFVVLLLAGIGTLFQLLAPYSTFGLIATNVLQPIWMAGNNVLASIAEYYDSYAFYHKDVWLRALRLAQRPYVLQHHLPRGNLPEFLLALLVPKDSFRHREMPQLFAVHKELQVGMHRLQDAHGRL